MNDRPYVEMMQGWAKHPVTHIATTFVLSWDYLSALNIAFAQMAIDLIY